MPTKVLGFPYACLILGLMLSVSGGAQASHDVPQLIEQAAKISPPGPSGQIVRRVAISDKYLLMATRRNTERPEGAWSEQFAHLFRRRGNGKWIFVSTLATTSLPNQETPVMAIDLRDRIAAVNAGELIIFELHDARWREVARLPSGGNLDLEIDAGTIVVSEPGCAWEAFRRVDGTWTSVGAAPPSNTCNLNPGFGEDIDISGTRIVVANPFISNPQGTQWPSRVRVFEGLSSTAPDAFITDPLGQNDNAFAYAVAVEGETVFAARDASVLAFERDSGGTWNHVATLEPVDSELLFFLGAVQSRNGLTAIGYPLDPLRGSLAGSVRVFRREAAGTYTEIARLLASDATDGTRLGDDVDVDGRLIAATALDAAYVFRLPVRLVKGG